MSSDILVHTSNIWVTYASNFDISHCVPNHCTPWEDICCPWPACKQNEWYWTTIPVWRIWALTCRKCHFTQPGYTIMGPTKQTVIWTEAYSRVWGLHKQKSKIGRNSLFATPHHTEQLHIVKIKNSGHSSTSYASSSTVKDRVFFLVNKVKQDRCINLSGDV